LLYVGKESELWARGLRVLSSEALQAIGAQAVPITISELLSLFSAEFDFRTPTTFEGSAAVKWLAAGFAFTGHSFFRQNEFGQFTQHHCSFDDSDFQNTLES
jgi:hypothetical protein